MGEQYNKLHTTVRAAIRWKARQHLINDVTYIQRQREADGDKDLLDRLREGDAELLEMMRESLATTGNHDAILDEYERRDTSEEVAASEAKRYAARSRKEAGRMSRERVNIEIP